MKIRCFSEGDGAQVLSLWRACGLVAPQNDPVKDIERKIRRDRENFLVGELSDLLIATCMVGYDGHRGWINYLAVSPAFRRRGYGAEMMSRAEVLLREQGCPKINLQVRAVNSAVIRFYRSIGFGVDEVVSLGKRLESDQNS
ncbi:GNAT family acetyltransferase [Desulfomarina sp.]